MTRCNKSKASPLCFISFLSKFLKNKTLIGYVISSEGPAEKGTSNHIVSLVFALRDYDEHN